MDILKEEELDKTHYGGTSETFSTCGSHKKMSTGKIMGWIAFIVSEIIAIILAIVIIFDTLNHGINMNNFSGLLTYQGTIFVTIFTSKASSNFAKKLGGT